MTEKSELRDEFDELRFAVDVPLSYPNRHGEHEWVAIEYFATREEAIKYAQRHFNADENGCICLVSSF